MQSQGSRTATTLSPQMDSERGEDEFVQNTTRLKKDAIEMSPVEVQQAKPKLQILDHDEIDNEPEHPVPKHKKIVFSSGAGKKFKLKKDQINVSQNEFSNLKVARQGNVFQKNQTQLLNQSIKLTFKPKKPE